MPLYWPTEAELERIEQLASIGLNKAEIAGAIGKSREWWYNQVELGNSQITNAYANGKARHAKDIMQALHDVATQDKNVAALIFLARANLRRQDRPSVKVDARSVTTVNGNQITGTTKAERIAALRAVTDDLQKLIEADDE